MYRQNGDYTAIGSSVTVLLAVNNGDCTVTAQSPWSHCIYYVTDGILVMLCTLCTCHLFFYNFILNNSLFLFFNKNFMAICGKIIKIWQILQIAANYLPKKKCWLLPLSPIVPWFDASVGAPSHFCMPCASPPSPFSSKELGLHYLPEIQFSLEQAMKQLLWATELKFTGIQFSLNIL